LGQRIESPVATGTPVRGRWEPALSGGWIPRARYSRPPCGTEVPPFTRERMPLTNLCSQLVVTSTRWTAPLPSLGLSPVRPPRPASPFRPSLRPSFQNATVHSDAEGPLPACSTLGGDTVDAASPAAANPTAPKGCPVSRAHRSQGALSAPHEPDGLASRHPLSPKAPFPGIPRSVPEGQDLRREPPVKTAPASQVRGAFHRQVS
jgi:hypothetical protein